MRTYICTGLGLAYTIPANSSTAAKIKAGSKYREETSGTFTATFYAQYFEPRLVLPNKPGKKPTLPK